MSRVRGKKRMEIIKKFLEGNEDPEYEVIPTVNEGNHFVKPRKQVDSKRKHSREGRSKDRINEEPIGSEEEDISDDLGTDSNKEQTKQKPPKPPKQPKSPGRHGAAYQDPYYDPAISYQILEQLKLL